jgi:hypothetical protein
MKRFVGVVLLGLIGQLAVAQREVDDNSKWTDRIYVGGGGGLNFGTNSIGDKYFAYSINPVVGYMITPQFSAGTGFSYQGINYSDRNFKYSQYGILPFVRYNFNDLFLTAEYNLINFPVVTYSSGGYSEANRAYRSRFLLGAGYTQRLGDRLAVNAMAMYDVLYSRPSPFLSPWVFRVFFSF